MSQTTTTITPIKTNNLRTFSGNPTTPKTPPKDRCYAFVMMCSAKTEDECFAKGLLGCPVAKNSKIADYLGNDSLLNKPIVLFNYSTGVVHLNLVATSGMYSNIDKNAFGGNYPNQIKINTSKVGWALCDSQNNHYWKDTIRSECWLTKKEYMKWYEKVPWHEAEWYEKDQKSEQCIDEK